jgi:hypothetical protein
MQDFGPVSFERSIQVRWPISACEGIEQFARARAGDDNGVPGLAFDAIGVGPEFMIEFESMLVGGEDRLDAGARPFVSLALGGGDQRMGPAGLATEARRSGRGAELPAVVRYLQPALSGSRKPRSSQPLSQ